MTTTTEQQLPTLTGSDKQVAWAADVRAEQLAKLADALSPARVAGTAVRVKALVPACKALAGRGLHGPRITEALVAAVATEGSAGWWIDHRLDGEVALVELACARISA